MFKKTIRRTFNIFGYDISRRGQSFTMSDALQRCFHRGLTVNSVIDVGASDGRWSAICMNVFPDADYLLIEAQDSHQCGLDLFKKDHSNVEYILAAAGNKTGKIFFNNSDPFGGSASDIPFKNNNTEVPCTHFSRSIA